MKRLLLLLLLAAPLAAQGPGEAVVNGPIHDSTEIECDLPTDQHVKNFGAPADGKGLCVFASMTMLARWHHQLDLIDVIHKINEGGGWPGKVDQVLKQHSPATKYIQYEGVSPQILDEAMARRGAACVTYGYGERYKMQTIYHMVLLVHLDQKLACIVDNNFPGTYEWMSREEFLKRWKHPGGKGWAFTFLESPPPPVPRS